MIQPINIVNFILGNKCNSGCSHCFSNSTKDSKAKLAEEIALKYARIISQNSEIQEVHFNGGEPLLYLETLCAVTELSQVKQKKIIKIATGAGEFTSLEATTKIFQKIQNIDELWVSIDPYHLEQVSLNNYKNLDTILKDSNIKTIYSISFKNIKEFAQTLGLIENNNFKYHKIVKQPVFAFGRAIKIKDVTHHFDDKIPIDYKCPETNIATVWPSGSVTNCSAYAGRAGFSKHHPTLEEFLRDNESDVFFAERNTEKLFEIANKRGLIGPFDVTSPCSTCKSILNKNLKQAISHG